MNFSEDFQAISMHQQGINLIEYDSVLSPIIISFLTVSGIASIIIKGLFIHYVIFVAGKKKRRPFDDILLCDQVSFDLKSIC